MNKALLLDRNMILKEGLARVNYFPLPKNMAALMTKGVSCIQIFKREELKLPNVLDISDNVR